MRPRGFQQQSRALLGDSTCRDELGERMGFPKEHEALSWIPLGFRLPVGRINAICVGVLLSRSEQLSCFPRTRPRRSNSPRLPPNVTVMG
jgi:hypothetical protein